MQDLQPHFTSAAERFDSSPISHQLSQMVHQLFAQLQLERNQHWLDFGAGTGLLSVPLARHVATVSALDTSAAMLEQLAEKNISNINCLNQDIAAGLPQQYHGVVSSMALHHVADIPQLFACLYDNLLPGGQLAIIDLYAEDGSFHGDNHSKGVKHLGFIAQHLIKHASEAGFDAPQQQEFAAITHRNGRDYPLFLLQAHKPQ